MTTGMTSRARLAGLLVVGLSLSACNESQNTTEPVANLHEHHAVTAKSPLGGSGGTLLKEVHAATARFHSTKQAEDAGYLVDNLCVAVPGLGGMGHHWAKPGIVDPNFDALNPEVVLYAPDKHGNMKLVAVEYIVVNIGQTAPTFDGQPFDVGGAPPLGSTPHWTLHVWIGKPNPNGTFAAWNPDVSCN